MKTLDQAMLMRAAQAPESLALQDPNGALHQGELAVAAYASAHQLAMATQASRVGICLPSIKEYAIAFYAAMLCGKTVVPINFLLQPKEIAHVVKDSEIDLIITSEHFAEALSPLGVTLIKIEDVGAALAGADLSSIKPEPCANPQEVAVMLYTSGTTALPKGVQLTHENLLAQAKMAAGFLDLDVYHLLSPLPLFHTFALTVCLILPTITPLRVSLLPRFTPLEAIGALQSFGANCIVGVPSMHRMISRLAKKQGLKGSDLGLVIGVAGGERLPPEIYHEYRDLLGIELIEGYGMTEHSPIIAANPPGKSRAGFVGVALPGVQIRTVNEQGEATEAGVEGELQIKSASVMKGYHNAESQPIDAEGWLTSGDLAVIDEEGWLKITGRLKELIISAGKNIHPAEVEDAVLDHEAVAACGVIAMPDKTRGEAIACFFTLEEGAALSAEDLKEWLRSRVADYKLPRFVKAIDAMPTTMTGKVLRRGLLAHLPNAEE